MSEETFNNEVVPGSEIDIEVDHETWVLVKSSEMVVGGQFQTSGAVFTGIVVSCTHPDTIKLRVVDVYRKESTPKEVIH